MSIGLCGRHGCQIVDGLCEKCQLEATEFMRPHDELATLRASLERAEAELDEAFKMSRCECGADECCANLVRACQETLAAQSTIAELRGALTEAIESIEDWSGYASPYFRDKYDVEGQIASLRSVLKEH